MLVAIFAERESHAAFFLQDAVNLLKRSRLAGKKKGSARPERMRKRRLNAADIRAEAVLVHQIQGCAVVFRQLHGILPGKQEMPLGIS